MTLNKGIFNANLYKGVFDLWFSGLPAAATAPKQEHFKRWFGGASEFDSECRMHCQSALHLLGPEKLMLPKFTSYQEDRRTMPRFIDALRQEIVQRSNETKAETALSMVLLLDQMPRNIFRDDQALIYGHYDRLARALVRSMLDSSPDGTSHISQLSQIISQSEFKHSPAHRTWFMLPLMHSEDLHDHDTLQGIANEMRNDVQEGDEPASNWLDTSMNFEKKHRDIIEKFGRYPHRNLQLGRESTPEESRWMDEGGDSFGTKTSKA